MKRIQHKDSFCITGSGIKCCLQGRAHIAMVTCSNPSQWVFLGEEDDTGGRASSVPVDGVILAIRRKQAGSQPSFAGCFTSNLCSEPSTHCRWTLPGHFTSSPCSSWILMPSEVSQLSCVLLLDPCGSDECYLLTPFWSQTGGCTDPWPHNAKSFIKAWTGKVPPGLLKSTGGKEIGCSELFYHDFPLTQGCMGQGRMSFRKQKTALEERMGEALFPQVCTHIVPSLSAHCIWGRGGGGRGLARCEEEGLHALYSHSNYPICCNHSPI